ncbi:MAG: peptidoglycan-associated lipoprotein Pal [Gammaproteobacteria bacterium]|jgi:peptidoglycan-associated lipoprotein
MKRRAFLALAVSGAVVTLTGCSSSGGSMDGEGAGAGAYGYDDASLQARIDSKTVYFDFDSSNIRAEDYPVLDAHASNLASSGKPVVIEGHCDERGTREYNLALGERRANTVRRYLMSRGVSSSQIEVLSYGEERPADYGHNESAWSKNRRAYLDY